MAGIRKARYDYIGYKYKGMEVIERTNERTKSGVTIWLCKCDCGMIHKRDSMHLLRQNVPRECKNYKPWNKKYISAREGLLYRNYGIKQKDYNEMFKNQKGCCAICGKHQSEFDKPLFVDHNHETGEVRDLLCNWCNYMVGILEDNNFEIAKKYLEKWSNSR
jgi:hypothetical protein